MPGCRRRSSRRWHDCARATTTTSRIGLIDAFACAADVLTFYQERIANESYLRTATERVSLQEMGKLIGYRLRPGVAAETWLAFALETPPTPPADAAARAGHVRHRHAREADARRRAAGAERARPGEKPQTFETVEALADARPAWNAMRPWMSEPRVPAAARRKPGCRRAHNLKPGDALLFVGGEFLANPTPATTGTSG